MAIVKKLRDAWRGAMQRARERRLREQEVQDDLEAAHVWHLCATDELRASARALVGKRIGIMYSARFAGTTEAALVLKHALTDIGAIMVGTDEDPDARVEIRRGSADRALFEIVSERGERAQECHPDLVISQILRNLADVLG